MSNFDYTKDGSIAVVTITRPERMNSLSWACHAELREIFEDFVDDADLRVAILTGQGDRAFCAGADLKEIAEGLSRGDQQRSRPVPWGGITAGFACWKPLIAAVQGVALGGGTELCLVCDIVVASETATFGLPEPRRGIAPAAGGVHRLARQVGLKNAMGMMLTGRVISADEALRIGLVNEVVAPADLMATAKRWADDVVACAPLSVQAIKRAATSFLHVDLEVALATQESSFGPLHQTNDALEGTTAFSQRRQPRWSGS